MAEKINALPQRLRRMSDGPVDAIDAEILCLAADEIERLRAKVDDFAQAYKNEIDVSIDRDFALIGEASRKKS